MLNLPFPIHSVQQLLVSPLHSCLLPFLVCFKYTCLSLPFDKVLIVNVPYSFPKVVATDMNNTDFVGVAMLHINLTNWNDEEPIFEYATTTISFNETEGEGFYVGRMLATDRDIDDRVE